MQRRLQNLSHCHFEAIPLPKSVQRCHQYPTAKEDGRPCNDRRRRNGDDLLPAELLDTIDAWVWANAVSKSKTMRRLLVDALEKGKK
jgi:hypothetical protein